MTTTDDIQHTAQDFIRLAAAGDFTGAGRLFDSTLAQALPEARLQATWLQIISQMGAFQKMVDCQAVDRQGSRVVTVTCQFEKAALDFRLVFTAGSQMSGLNVHLAAAATPYHPPAYVRAEAFHDVEVTVGGGDWALPGTLSLPVGAGPWPGVVLVHGSGPNDRDKSIGPNKPFRDLAGGLASQGIAVLRYEKRTKAHAARYTAELKAKVTVQDEVVDDALLAVQLLRQTAGLDPRRIYVLGHSLGATLAPRLGQQDPALAGLIIMGGMTRPLEDTILDQYTYLYGLSGALTDENRAELEQLRAKVARVKDPDLSNQVPATDLPLDVAPAYWLALRGYQPAEVAQTLAMRLFVLQAGRDYQVTTAGDYPAWQAALGDRPNATLKLYPSLFHLFISGEGPSTPQEYTVEGHVSEEVVEDVARWVNG